LSRTPFLAKQYGPLVNVFRELKRVFDPHGILNPGKIVPIAPTRMTQHMRATGRVGQESNPGGEGATAAENGRSRKLLDLQLAWNEDEMAATARVCNGCG